MKRMAMVVAAAVATAVLAVGAAAAPVRQSGTYVCGYGHSSKAGEVYLVLGIKPGSIGPSACNSFNSTFHGTKVNVHHKLGTGTVYCKYKYVKTGLEMIAAVFAQTASGGHQFCAAFHPKGWKKF